MIATVEELFAEIDQHFLAPGKSEYAAVFAHAGRQVEGWFKGELLSLFSALQKASRLAAWASEASLPGLSKKKADFRVDLDSGPVFLELKTLFQGLQGASKIALGMYFYKDGVGIWPDVQRLANLTKGRGFCLLFLYPCPDQQLWQETLAA